MKRVGQSIILRRQPDEQPQHFYVVRVRTMFIPTTLAELPYNTVTLDGNPETTVTINTKIVTAVIRE